MNEIRVKRLLLAGVTMFVVWIAVEILVEQVLLRLVFGSLVDEQWMPPAGLSARSRGETWDTHTPHPHREVAGVWHGCWRCRVSFSWPRCWWVG